jgi:hypothetical protein
MKRLIFFFVLCILSPILLFSETYTIDSQEVSDLRYLYRQAKRAFPVGSYPVHGSDLLDAANKLRGNLKAEDTLYLERVIESLSLYDREAVLAGGALAANYQHRLRTGELLLDEGNVKNSLDFHRAFLSFPPFLELEVWGGTFTGLFIEAKAGFRPPWKDDYSPDNNFILPASELDIAFNILSKGVISWNSKYIDIFLGRDNLHFGETPGATLYPSRMLPNMDALRLYVPIGPFSLDYLLATIQPKKALYDINPNGGIPDNPLTAHDPDSGYFGFMNDPYPSTILTAMHHFVWNFGPLKAGIGSTVVYARSNNMFLITDILPVSTWHNADIRPNNLNLIFDISWAVYPGLTLSGMFGFDDINADIIGIPDSETPTIPAFIIQLEYGLRKKLFKADFLLEGGFTHYLWGNFAFRSNDVWGEVALARAIYRFAPNNTAVLLPLTSPYGPGTIWGRFLSSVAFSAYDFKISADLLFISKNREVNLVETPYIKNDALNMGRRVFYMSLDIPCTYTRKYMEVNFTPSLIARNKRVAFECTLGVGFKLGGYTTF